ncbi:MAG TPA: hypothetical protein PLX95_03325, partial [bacterium]|nr:hypothetical protein [bacterium]
KGRVIVAGTIAGAFLTGSDIGVSVQGYNVNTTILGSDISLTSEVSGILPLANGGTGSNLVDPNADRIMFWDDSGSAVTWLSVGAGLQISGTAISSTITDTNTTYTAGNGLSLSGTEVQLGGTLSKSTSVLAGNFDMIFNLDGTGDFRIQDAGTDVFFVKDDGNIGIGITNPTDKLHVVGNILATSGFHVGVDGDGTLIDDASNGSSSTTLYIGNESILASGDIGVTVQGYDANTTKLGSSIDLPSEVTGTLTVPYGGTGSNTLTNNGVLIGAGTGPITATTGTPAQFLLVNSSSIPTFQSLSGDATISNTGVLTLASTSVTPSTYGSSTMIPIITVDSKGRVISASSVVVTDLNTTYTASNGLTLSGTEVQLGGTLSKSTSVLAGNYDMIFNLSGTGAFRIQSSGTDVALVNDMGNTIIGANLIVESPTTDGLTLSSNIVTNETGMYERVSDQTIISYNYNDLGTYLGSARSMYIGSSGSVGIGTTNPGLYKLNVAGSFIATDYFSGDGTLGAEYSSGGLVFKDGLYTGGTFPQETTFGTVTGTGVSGQVSYWDGASSQTGSNNLWFTGTKLGIGTTAPSQELDVVGDIELSNYLYFGNGSTEYLRWDGSDFIL